MTQQEICNYAEEISKKYNPQGLSPFPYQDIQKDKSDLKMIVLSATGGLSGL